MIAGYGEGKRLSCRWLSHHLVGHLVSVHTGFSRCLGCLWAVGSCVFSGWSVVAWVAACRVPAEMQPNCAYCSSPAPTRAW